MFFVSALVGVEIRAINKVATFSNEVVIIRDIRVFVNPDQNVIPDSHLPFTYHYSKIC